jgi:high-affinity Fe2+/Pb2+ permease
VIILKFGDIIIAVASLTIVAVLIMFPLTLAFTSTLGNFGGFMLSAVVAFLLGAIIVGYVFTRRIWEENRTRTIAKIAVLFTLLVMVAVLIENAASADWTPMVRESYLEANPGASPSTSDWYYIERLALVQDDFFNVVLLFAIAFIGLYIGSILKKPAGT